jgi:predicted nucleic acid-binding protein
MVDLMSALHPHARIGLDTSIFIYHIEPSSLFSGVANTILRQLARRTMTGVTSVLTLTELLVKPLQSERRGLAARYEALVRAIPNLTVVDIDSRIARRAATLRAAHAIPTADALHLASALEHGASAFVTNDRRLRRVNEITVLVLGELLDP